MQLYSTKQKIIIMAVTYLEKWNTIPVTVKQFLLRAVLILVIWKVLYLVFLLPTRVLDKPLSHSVATSATWLLNATTGSTDYSAKSEAGNVNFDGVIKVMPLDDIYFGQRNVVSIEDGCNALELFILYIGFIVCMPAAMSRKVLFVVAGTIMIYVVNVIRCAGITYIILYYPQHADFAHHYVFTFIVYGFIIALWLIFAKKLNLVHAETE